MQNIEGKDSQTLTLPRTAFPLHGWLGLVLAALFWSINWGWQGLRTHWAFFPM